MLFKYPLRCGSTGPKVTAAIALAVVLTVASEACGDQPASFDTLGNRYERQIQPLLQRFCLDCHSAAQLEGELDLQRFTGLTQIRQEPRVWQKVAEMLDNGEMPPAESEQPSGEQRKLLRDWIDRYLEAEARASAGDPGPVVLRRLNNAEYTYTVRDLTGVARLDPAAEFPVDGAAGEGFTNTGNAQGMSPAMVQKYLDAAKTVAEHAVLLPDGFRFSPSTTRREWSDEILNEIRALYARHTTGESDTSILNRWSGAEPTRSTENDGRVNLVPYLTVLVQHRDRLREIARAPDSADAEQDFNRWALAAAKDARINPKYLGLLARMLVSDDCSPLLEDLRQRWSRATPDDARRISMLIGAWQDRLWRFNAVGHLGLVQPWQQAVDPLPSTVTRDSRLTDSGDHSVRYLIAGDAGDGSEGDLVRWHEPRIEFARRPAILLRDVPRLEAAVRALQTSELPRVERYLAAVADLHRRPESVERYATRTDLHPGLLRHWCQLLTLGQNAERTINGHFRNKVSRVHGYEAINGWGDEVTPSLLTNRSNEAISFLTLTVPARGVTVHPSPERDVGVSWRSPIGGSVRVSGLVADADGKCGNGAAWRLELLDTTDSRTLGHGVLDNGRSNVIELADPLVIEPGDVLSLVISARDHNHACDTTHIELRIAEQVRDGSRENRRWDLAGDIIDRIHQSNPLADGYGHDEVWHYRVWDEQPSEETVLPAGSALANWRAAVVEGATPEQLSRHAAAVAALASGRAQPRSEADEQLVQLLGAWQGPLDWVDVAMAEPSLVLKPETSGREAPAQSPLPRGAVESGGKDGVRGQVSKRSVDNPDISEPPAEGGFAHFEKHSESDNAGSADLLVRAPSVLEFRLPAELVAGGELVVEGGLAEAASGNGSVQLTVSSERPASAAGLLPGEPILTRDGSSGRQRVLAAYRDFRQLFPAAMCHARIVPVDEVVTLLLYHREDHHLVRLMLDEHEAERLNRLWDELRYVSQDALRIEVALEQILEFATQDADPRRFDPVRQPIADGAERFRKLLIESESAHIEAVVDFASRAFRRPLRDGESQGLRSLYHALRGEGLGHEEAFRLTLARILTSPAFLYRLEQAPEGSKPAEVSSWELASRLSYFLTSSVPDAELRAAAERDELREPAHLLEQTRRLLRSQHARRLATEFACQWLHIRDFDQLDEKNERRFPEFQQLREPMYEESVRFLTDLFQNDRSILSILDADHTFVNDSLAQFYGIPASGSGWQRVDGVKRYARGGILGQAAVLAKQSGASRTSPILRGNWVYETLLGQQLPRPPKDVPQLPEDAPQGLSERALIEQHSAIPGCAKCHARIDPYGFALENYDAIGRFRDVDQEGHTIDARSQLPGGLQIDGFEGLRAYLLEQRREDFVRHFCRKLLGYALGRAVQLSDEPLLDRMMQRLAANDYRVAVAVEAIVASEQFRMIRGADHRGSTKHTVNEETP